MASGFITRHEDAVDDLHSRLQDDFNCLLKVWVRPALFPHRKLQIDLLAIPLDDDKDFLLGFEVKSLSGREWRPQNTAKAYKQAHDYLFSAIDDPKLPDGLQGRRIMACFIYPASIEAHRRETTWTEEEIAKDQETSRDRCKNYAFVRKPGVAQMMAHFRIGEAMKDKAGVKIWLAGTIYTSDIVRGRDPDTGPWEQIMGVWEGNWRQMLVGKRQIGSQRFPILEEFEQSGWRP